MITIAWSTTFWPGSQRCQGWKKFKRSLTPKVSCNIWKLKPRMGKISAWVTKLVVKLGWGAWIEIRLLFPYFFFPSLVGCPKPSLSEPPYSWVSSKTNLPSENYRADRRWSRCPRSHRDHGICKLSETGIQHQGHHSLLCFTSQGEFRILNWVWPSWCTFESAGWLFEMKWENIATQSTMVS